MMGRLFGQGKERERRDELLSAYLDGELSAGERARLEAQLATEPALQAELKALRQTVALVRDLPQVPVPRNFILSQTMASQPRPAPLARPRRAWVAPLLTAATAGASLLFVAVLSLDLLLPGMRGNLAFAPAPEPQMAAEAPREVEAPPPVEQEVEVEEAAEAPPPEAEAPAEMSLEASAEVEQGEELAPEPERETATIPAMEGAGLTATLAPVTVLPKVEEPDTAPTALVTALAAAEAQEEGEGHWDSTPGEPAEPTPPPVEEEADEAAEGEMAGAVRPAVWRSLEIVLGLIALTLAAATVWAWRARRR